MAREREKAREREGERERRPEQERERDTTVPCDKFHNFAGGSRDIGKN